MDELRHGLGEESDGAHEPLAGEPGDAGQPPAADDWAAVASRLSAYSTEPDMPSGAPPHVLPEEPALPAADAVEAEAEPATEDASESVTATVAADAVTAVAATEVATGRRARLSFRHRAKGDEGSPERASKAKKQDARRETRRKHAKKLVGLKIGSSQIAAARIENNGSPELVEVIREPLAAGLVSAGEIRDPDALAEVLRGFFSRHKLPKKGIRLGLSNNRIGVRVFEIEGVMDERQLENAIRYRAEEVLPIPLDQAVLDYVVLGEDTREDGTPSRRILLVVAYRDAVERYLLACRGAGLDVVGVDLEAFALLRSLAPPTDQPSKGGGLVAVNVGHDRTTMAVSTGRYCEFTRVLDWGGWALNVAIARELDRAPSEVEGIKRQLSFAAKTVVDGLTPEQTTKVREAAQRALATYARELVASLQFYQAQPGALGIGEVLVTGGTSQMPGFPEELGRLIGVPVTLGDPFRRVRVGRKVVASDSPGSLAVAIGLGIED
ncbi:MAG TPA: type IV pilus assembly protein PilM [Gaiellaceae bacterium]|nr:type IV pilus assembly protein PilM [Gaiellaceae bacterium]